MKNERQRHGSSTSKEQWREEIHPVFCWRQRSIPPGRIQIFARASAGLKTSLALRVGAGHVLGLLWLVPEWILNMWRISRELR
jgi:hypothetical protein